MNQQYPLGHYQPVPYSPDLKNDWILSIKEMPVNLQKVAGFLNETQLETPYRDQGWTIKEVVHHIADSHMNGYIRCKMAYTETIPFISPYNEKLWAEIHDSLNEPVCVSLNLLHNLHKRWHSFFLACTEKDWEKSVKHPEADQPLTLWYLLVLYGHHGDHHVAQISFFCKKKGW